jgi:hypothetical protein
LQKQERERDPGETMQETGQIDQIEIGVRSRDTAMIDVVTAGTANVVVEPTTEIPASQVAGDGVEREEAMNDLATKQDTEARTGLHV